MKGLITTQREAFLRRLIEQGTWGFSRFDKYGCKKIASNADSGQKTSVQLSNLLLDKVCQRLGINPDITERKKDGQTAGNEFEEACAWFLQQTFPRLENLRPGKWDIIQVRQRNNDATLGRFEQYSHLSELTSLAEKHKELRNFLGDGYTVSPDVIITREPESDVDINQLTPIVDDLTARNTMLRRSNHSGDKALPLLHASMSCKFTMRSDRAQNTRTEALNLIRSRKGRTPHITSVTAEPMPNRLASLALGTGDLDYVYHFALYELIECCRELDRDDYLDTLMSMIEGKRLRDISDLPFDLAI